MNLEELARAYYENAKEILKKASEDPTSVRYDWVRMANEMVLKGLDRVKEWLERLARGHGGCVACAYSRPHPANPVDIYARSCELGLSQDRCNRFKPLV